MSTMTSIEKFKEQLRLTNKQFPLSHLLYLYEKMPERFDELSQMEAYNLITKWLAPIDIPQPPKDFYLPKLYRTYSIGWMTTILTRYSNQEHHKQITKEQIYYGYQTTITILQQHANSSLMSAQISTVQTELEI